MGKMTLHFDHDVVRKLWDNYYVPFVKGYFAANGRFRSDDVKTGALLGCVGSCASATFFPKQVMPGDNQVHDIEMKVLPAPRFAGSEKVAVQQGAGMVVTTGTEAEINGAVTFLKWFTEPQNNIAFAVESGYLPVTTAANDMDAIRAKRAGTDRHHGARSFPARWKQCAKTSCTPLRPLQAAMQSARCWNTAWAIRPVPTGTRCWNASPQARARKQPRRSF